MRKFAISAFILVFVICTALSFSPSTNQTQTEKDRSSKRLRSPVALKGSHAQENAELKKGKLLYNKYSCLSCHGPDGILQGNLTNAYKKFTDEQIKAYITNANRFNNFKMPVYENIIPDTDYQPLIAYVKWLGERAGRK